NRATNSIATAGWILSFSALASALLGLARTRLLLDVYGVGIETDIYNAAFRIPDLVYTLAISGAISAAFIPVFVSYLARNKKEAWHLAQSFLYIALAAVGVLSLVLFIAMPYLMPFLAPGFSESAREETVTLSRIMLASPILLGVSAVFSGILQSLRKFIVYALAPLFYNAGLIVGIVVFTRWWGIDGLAWGVVLGAALHAAVQAPFAFSSGFRLGLPTLHPAVRRVARLMAPRSLALGVSQLNLVVVTALASMVSTGAITIFMNANKIEALLAGILGVSFATALFPALAEAVAKNDEKQYLDSFSKIFRGVLFLTLPASALFFVLRAQIVRVAYGTSQVTWEDTRLMAASLGLFAIGSFAYALVPVVARAFYAREDTITPVIASVVGFFVNIGLALWLLFVVFENEAIHAVLTSALRVSDVPGTSLLALPLAFSLSGIAMLSVLLITFFANPRNRSIIPAIAGSFVRVSVATALASSAAWMSLYFFAAASPTDTLARLALQGLTATLAASAVYLSFAYLGRFPELDVLRAFVFSKIMKAQLPQAATTEPDPTSGGHSAA
ncbi:MAG: murein biosynthesis integral membrane protein MurJ, partial [Candidatus Spechtbacterales bacterium]